MNHAPTLYDVCVVGAGPAGSTCAYYLARLGGRVLLLEKAEFPRDKLCGDAICGNARTHLQRMGVLQEILANHQGHCAAVGGLVSPRGIRFIGNSVEQIGASLAIAIKRKILDEKIARAAVRAGAVLAERSPVTGAEFSSGTGTWTVHCRSETPVSYQAKVLVAADGSQSALARSLGILHSLPDAICSRTYIDAATSDFDADGVMFYPAAILPGYCSLFREAGGHLSFCCYILPGGSCQVKDLKQIYHRMLEHDPHVSRAVGPHARMGPMQGAFLRLGGVPKSYADHLLLLGDAAGQIDPMTGEGIQYAMDAAEIAAQTLVEASSAGNFSEAFLRRYHNRWMKSFGNDFAWSRRIAQFTARQPLFLDAGAALMRRRGASFLAEWGEVMTGVRPKSYYLRPSVAWQFLRELAYQWWETPHGQFA